MTMRILIVEDDEHLQSVLLEVAASNGYEAEGVGDAETALELLADKTFDTVIADVSLPGMSGLDLLPRISHLQPDITSIVMTGNGTIDTAVEAMKRGASDFLIKPFTVESLTSGLRVVADRLALTRTQKVAAPPSETKSWATSNIVATSSVMRKLLGQVASVAPYNTTVLVTGETGTGKEMIARALHEQSPRSARPLVALNCAAVPEHLLEDELFGHVRGAFTGAQSSREGRFEQADGGTLFLDEIGDMSPPLQSKLLRVLQEREFEKLGSPRTIKVDVRIIAATSANLEERVAQGTFRPDLYYRLNVMHLRVPPLRERPEDVRPLANRLLARFCSSAGLPVKAIEIEAWRALNGYHWPGNVRQLQNAMERAAVLSGATPTISMSDLPEELSGESQRPKTFKEPAEVSLQAAPVVPAEGVDLDEMVTALERELLMQGLARAGGNKLHAAKLLNIKRTTLVAKLKRFGINAEDDTDTQAAAT